MPTRFATVTRRPAEPGDEELLRELFLDSRPEFVMLPPEMRESILDLQLRAQRQQYQMSYPNATDEIVMVDGVDVGRLILAEVDGAVRIVDVVVRESHRGQGIGSTMVSEVIAAAADRGLPVCLSVWSSNVDARRLYERLGFVAGDGGDGYLEMQRVVTTEGG
jgi:ribosomal protein S18 acetylase RimI-like enzyme